MKKNRFFKMSRIAVLLVFMMMVSACGNQKRETAEFHTDSENKEEKVVMLTARQIEILKDGGLPVKYEELSHTQKTAIMAIEEMLCYLEEKYDAEFIYLGYVPAGVMEKEHLLACRSDMSLKEAVSVYRQSDEDAAEKFTDDFPDILARPVYQAGIEDYVAGCFPETAFKVFTEDTDVMEDDFTEKDIFQKVWGSSTILIDEEVCSEEEMEKFAEDYSLWMQKESDSRAASSTTIGLVGKDRLKQINEYNYEDKIYDCLEGPHMICSISSEGDINNY